MTLKTLVICALSYACVAPAYSATPAAFASLDRRTQRACSQASGLRDATVGSAIRFSDRAGIDARTVTGTYPQAHMNGATSTMLCVYNRATRRAETQEMSSTSRQPAETLQIRDILWRGVEINGRATGNSPITLMFGSNGKAVGRSACNNYSVTYRLSGRLSGNGLRIYPDMMGTRMGCPDPLMAQETLYRATLAASEVASIEADSSLLLSGPNGQSLRFEREASRPQ
jgi:heat shock protein HslJ